MSLALRDEPHFEPIFPTLDAAAPESTETAIFALGWFWGPDSRFGSLPGVVRTRVGYAGGTTHSPTYHHLGDHAETLEIVFDPSRISYAGLLEVFWHSHSPTRPPWSRQYKSAIFTHGAEQQRQAEASKAAAERVLGAKIHTEIAAAGEFTAAEDYHQKYMLRRHGDLLLELGAIYPRTEDLVASTAAARINGYVAGCGRREDFDTEVDGYGLSPAATRKLRKIVERKLEREP